MKHLTDANKDKLLAFLRSRAAAGEASLKSWGRDQRPQIPGVLVEEIADALVTDGKATRETRTHGGRVWRAAVEAPPAPEPDVEEEPEEEPVVVAGDAEPAQDVVRLLRCDFDAIVNDRESARDAFRYLRGHLSRALDLPDGGPISGIIDRVRLLVAGAKARAEAPAADEDARVRDYLLALPEHLWQRLGAARAKIAKARQAVLDAQAAESKLLAEIGAVLDAPLDEPKKRKAVRVGEEPPRDSSLGQTLALVRAGHPGDHKSIADALGRRFFRFSLGGIRDEAEIKGRYREALFSKRERKTGLNRPCPELSTGYLAN